MKVLDLNNLENIEKNVTIRMVEEFIASIDAAIPVAYDFEDLYVIQDFEVFVNDAFEKITICGQEYWPFAIIEKCGDVNKQYIQWVEDQKTNEDVTILEVIVSDGSLYIYYGADYTINFTLEGLRDVIKKEFVDKSTLKKQLNDIREENKKLKESILELNKQIDNYKA